VTQLSRMGRSLLVLDNVEHVIDTTAFLVTEVLGATKTHVVVTSREPLNIPGEVVYTLGPLDPTSAIELYRDRAVSVSPGFEASAATLDMLCEELDYMPLAIEMAAARSKALAPDEILTRISRRYGLLDKPLRGGAERHRSLDSLVDWSYSLLDDPDQRVFERLSVVSGTFDVDLAMSVAGFGDVAPEQVAGILASLVRDPSSTEPPPVRTGSCVSSSRLRARSCRPGATKPRRARFMPDGSGAWRLRSGMDSPHPMRPGGQAAPTPRSKIWRAGSPGRRRRVTSTRRS